MSKMPTPSEKMNKLRAALIERGTDSSVALSQRLDRCAVDWKGRYECRSPACAHCKRRHITRERVVVDNWFGHHDNSDLALVTVVVGATSDATQLGDSFRRSRDTTRKRIANCRDGDGAWDNVYLAGWHEVDAVAIDQMPLIPPRRRALLENIVPAMSSDGSPNWITTWHGIMHSGGLPIDEITCEFRQQWKHPGQVDVRAFDLSASVKSNLDRITSYVNKFGCSTTLMNDQVEPWPSSWQAEYYSALQSAQRNPFEALRFTVRPRDSHDHVDVKVVDELSRRQPLPCSISRVSMSDNTGRIP